MMLSTDHHDKKTNRIDSNGGQDKDTAYNDLTPAERRFLQQTERLELQRLAKIASKSHRDRIQQFNQYLATLSEHYDIPKVGPG
ncbi:protein FAM32A-like [Quillaja saponaria]|nr:protein FAM32A-like [Quillaja saponaria]